MPDTKRDGPRIAAVVLAAGMSTRMGRNKLLADIDGESLIRRVVRAINASRAHPIIVVIGHDGERVRAALADANIKTVRNPAFREGLGTSIRTGIGAVEDCDGAIILLGDMPAISSSLIDKMISALDPDNGRAICVATCNGRRGNPVLFDRRFFPELQAITGDVGARDIVARYRELVCEVEADNEGPLIDLDTPEGVEQFLRRP